MRNFINHKSCGLGIRDVNEVRQDVVNIPDNMIGFLPPMVIQ